jgi:hypothetical protein
MRQRVGDLIQDADYFCLLTTKEALKRDWIRFEFKEAAALLGRIMFVCKDELPISGYTAVERLNVEPYSHQMVIKHTTLCIPEITDRDAEELGVQLINDPHEGWYDGRADVKKLFPRRGLRRQSQLRRAARKSVMMDSKYANQEILDVIPYTESDVDVWPKEDFELVLEQLILDGGRLELEQLIAKKQVEVFLTWYSATGSFLDAGEGGFGAFVIVGVEGAHGYDDRHTLYLQ